MMKYYAMILCLTWMSMSVEAQDVELIKYNQLENRIKNTKEEIVLVNFWATWCGPCVKELPHFIEADKSPNVKVFLVSVDFPEDLQKVKKMAAKRGLSSEVVLLDEKDYDSYMPRVSASWSGAIPATLFLDSNRKRYFYEQSFTATELQSTINKHLN